VLKELPAAAPHGSGIVMGATEKLFGEMPDSLQKHEVQGSNSLFLSVPDKNLIGDGQNCVEYRLQTPVCKLRYGVKQRSFDSVIRLDHDSLRHLSSIRAGFSNQEQ
jgi:hypothetical protein